MAPVCTALNIMALDKNLQIILNDNLIGHFLTHLCIYCQQFNPLKGDFSHLNAGGPVGQNQGTQYLD